MPHNYRAPLCSLFPPSSCKLLTGARGCAVWRKSAVVIQTCVMTLFGVLYLLYNFNMLRLDVRMMSLELLCPSAIV
eukprot:6051500-Pyramimonas_sp.AAC.1